MKTGIVLAVVIAVAVADAGFDPVNDCFKWNLPFKNGLIPLKLFNDCGVLGKKTAMTNADSASKCAFKAFAYEDGKLNLRRLLDEFSIHVNPKFMPGLLKGYSQCTTSPTFVQCWMKSIIDVCPNDLVYGKDA